MNVLIFIIGVSIPTIIGAQALRLCEGKRIVLLPMERLALGFVLGATLSMFVFSLLHWAGVMAIALPGMLLALVILIVVLSLALKRMGIFPLPMGGSQGVGFLGKSNTPPSHPFPMGGGLKQAPRWMQGLLLVLVLWTVIKLITIFAFAIAAPQYHDDTFDNWNLRAKVFHHTQQITQTDDIVEHGIRSYPPALPLLKTWFTVLRGQWEEDLVNSVHAVWYVCAVALVFCFLLRTKGWAAAVLGSYFVTSVPLYWIHGTAAYADLWLSLHVFAAVAPLYCALTAPPEDALAHVRLSAFALALLPFTKNEALLIYMPPAALLLIVTLVILRRRSAVNQTQLSRTVILAAGMLAAVTIPWLLYKWSLGLPFGNAKPISSLGLVFQPVVLRDIGLMLFFEGNWNLLFVMLIGLVAWQWRRLPVPTQLLIAFTVIVIAGYLVIFSVTSLSVEAQMQTGFNRGIIHLVPILSVILALLVELGRDPPPSGRGPGGGVC